MTANLENIELVGGPLCGDVIGVEENIETILVPYYRPCEYKGTVIKQTLHAEYLNQGNGKAQYLKG